MEATFTQTFRASVEGKLRIWDRSVSELELQLGTGAPELPPEEVRA